MARLMERNVQASVAQGQLDSPALRAALGQELIARELMVQEALRRGLDKRPQAEDALLVQRQNLLLDLLLPDQITPAISNVLVNLSAGAVSAAPIQVGPYWHVIKLLAKRSYQVPSFDDSKQQLQLVLAQNRRLQLLKKLQDAARIK